MRIHRITHNQFCEVFPSRELNIKHKIMKNIYITSDSGVIHIEERLSNVARLLIMPLVIFPLLIYIFFMEGAYGCRDFLTDICKYWILNKPTRVDFCNENVESTEKLISIAGWGK